MLTKVQLQDLVIIMTLLGSFYLAYEITDGFMRRVTLALPYGIYLGIYLEIVNVGTGSSLEQLLMRSFQIDTIPHPLFFLGVIIGAATYILRPALRETTVDEVVTGEVLSKTKPNTMSKLYLYFGAAVRMVYGVIALQLISSFTGLGRLLGLTTLQVLLIGVGIGLLDTFVVRVYNGLALLQVRRVGIADPPPAVVRQMPVRGVLISGCLIQILLSVLWVLFLVRYPVPTLIVSLSFSLLSFAIYGLYRLIAKSDRRVFGYIGLACLVFAAAIALMMNHL